MADLACTTGADIQRRIHQMRFDVTVRLIAYGQLREKTHTVRNPELYAAAVTELLED